MTCSREELTENTAESNPDVSRLSLSEEAGEDKTLAAESRWSTSGELESGSAASKLHPDQRMTSRGQKVELPSSLRDYVLDRK